MKRRRTKAALVVAALLLVAGAIAYVAGRGGDDESARRAPRSQQQEVAAALRRLTTDPDSLVAAPSRGLVGGRARRAVPEGATVTPHERSWLFDGHGGGVMTVTITAAGRRSTDYAAVMVKDGTAWKVLATVPAKRAPGPGSGP